MVRSNQVPLPDFVAGSPGRDPGGLWAIPARGPVIGSANVGGPRAAIGIGWSGPGGGDESLDRRHASSSPRLRGTRGDFLGLGDPGRFIPAPAGNTAPLSPRRTSRAVHPRACGEHGNNGAPEYVEVGSSPRLRGTQRLYHLAERRERFIPAPAGNTATTVPQSMSRSVHPRACGEHPDDPDAIQTTAGSSPRLRGTQTASRLARRRRRFIPAPAGNTAAGVSMTATASVHPRACGEHPPPAAGTVCRSGSSPRLRGTPAPLPWHRVRSRFIPAPAGNTVGHVHRHRLHAVHPRACGEHCRCPVAAGSCNGSSPRLRGTPGPFRRRGAGHRFIPAPAGNTPRRYTGAQPSAVHPRACGEHLEKVERMQFKAGSSPRLRGTRPLKPCIVGNQRFIPAPAGNTSSLPTNSRAPAVHPRACGEHGKGPVRYPFHTGSSPRLRGTRLREARACEAVRFIPAPAGNTPTCAPSALNRPVHPRACGEHRDALRSMREGFGSSPRLRGTRLAAALGKHMIRFIPAPAGNTPATPARRIAPPVHPRACGEHA